MPRERRHTDEQKEIIKQAMKEATTEWLDDKFRSFGKWSFYGIGAAALVLIVHLFLALDYDYFRNMILSGSLHPAHVK